MRPPTRDSIEGLRPISRNLSLDLIAAIGVGVSGALVSSLLPTIARRGGLAPLGLAVLAATPFLTNLLSVFAGVALAQGFFGGGFIAAGPLFALVNVDRLNLSLSDVGIIGVLSAVATTVSFLIWGSVSDRVDALAPMRFGSIIGLCGLLAYAVAPGVVVLWLAAVAIGTSNSSIEIGVAGVISAETPLASRAVAMSGWNAITGARGLVAPFVMSALVQVGLVSVTTALLFCAAASALGVALFWWAARRGRTELGLRVAPEIAG